MIYCTFHQAKISAELWESVNIMINHAPYISVFTKQTIPLNCNHLLLSS